MVSPDASWVKEWFSSGLTNFVLMRSIAEGSDCIQRGCSSMLGSPQTCGTVSDRGMVGRVLPAVSESEFEMPRNFELYCTRWWFLICSFIFGTMGVPWPNIGGLCGLDEALAGGVSFGVKLLAAVGLAWDGGAVEGLVLLAFGLARGTAVEESLGVIAGERTARAGVMQGAWGEVHDATECVLLKRSVMRWE